MLEIQFSTPFDTVSGAQTLRIGSNFSPNLFGVVGLCAFRESSSERRKTLYSSVSFDGEASLRQKFQPKQCPFVAGKCAARKVIATSSLPDFVIHFYDLLVLFEISIGFDSKFLNAFLYSRFHLVRRAERTARIRKIYENEKKWI